MLRALIWEINNIQSRRAGTYQRIHKTYDDLISQLECQLSSNMKFVITKLTFFIYRSAINLYLSYLRKQKI